MSMKRNVWHHVYVGKLVKSSGPVLLVAPGIPLKSLVEAALPVENVYVGGLSGREVANAKFRLEYSEAAGRYEIASFGIDRLNSTTEITGAFWRTVRVHSIVGAAIEMSLPAWTGSIVRTWHRRRAGVLANPPQFTSSDPDGLLLAATVYRIAHVSNENPALAVAETLGLKQRTATNWIARAREAGFLTSAEHQREVRRLAADLEKLNPWGTPRTEEEQAIFTAIMRSAMEGRPGGNR